MASTRGGAPRRLVVLGGSGASTTELADAIAAWPGGSGRRPVLAVILHGRSREKLALVADAFRARLGDAARDVDVMASSDLERALEGADVVLNQVRIGGLAARAFDETFPRAFGIPGEETMGPGGAANAMRTVPALAPVWDLIARRAPGVTVLNLTNPSGVVVAAAARAFGLTFISVCDSPIALTGAIADRLAIDLTAARDRYVGCNHLGWWAPADGAELARLADLAVGLEAQEVAVAGALPAPYARYYLAPEPILTAQTAEPPRAEQLRALEARQLAAYAAGEEGAAGAPRRGAVWYSTAVVPFLDAWWNGSPAPQILGLVSDGSIPGIPAGVVAERSVDLARPGTLEPRGAPNLPPYPASVLARHAAYESLMVEALAGGASRPALVRALAANPMVRSLGQAAALVDQILATSPRG
jgi:6-phospho-beta-glucosidase